MFQLSSEEYADLMSQFATSKPGRGGRRKLPLAFTEHGTIMAAAVLNSPRAVESPRRAIGFVTQQEDKGNDRPR